MEMIDTHAHIYLPEFDADRPEVLHRAAAAGVVQLLMPAIDSSTHKAMLEVEENFTACKSMIGLHPCSVSRNVEQELEVVAQYLQQRSFVAVGEIGLDFYWDVTLKEQQYHAFRRQIELALQYKLPIVIHSRNATAACIGVVQEYAGITGVFHCFSGNLTEAAHLIEAGFMLGIGGVVTFKNAGLDKIIQQLGIDNVILETDAPYLAPAPHRGKRNEPAYTLLVAQKISELLQMPVKEVVAKTTENAKMLFGL